MEVQTEEQKEDEKDLDKILTSIGMGSWHLLIFFINVLIWSVHGPHTMGSTILNAPVDFMCFNSTYSACTVFSSTEIKNATNYNSKCLEITDNINPVIEIMKKPSCSYISSGEHNLKFTNNPSCPVVLYDSSVFTETVTTDWNLICDSSMKRPLFQNIYSLGIVFGCFLVGPISDSIGRARSILIGSVLHILSSSVVVLVPSYSIVLVLRLVVGISNVLVLISAVTYAVENCPVAWRGPVGTFVGIPYSIWVSAFAVFAFYIRNWCYLYVAFAIPAILLLPAAMLLEESPRWLLQQGNESKAYEILLHAAKKNNASEETKQLIINLRDQSTDYNKNEYEGNNLLLNEKNPLINRESIAEIPIMSTSEIKPALCEIRTDSDSKEVSCTGINHNSRDETFYNNIENITERNVQPFMCKSVKLSKVCKNCATKTNMLWKRMKGEVVPFFRTSFMRRIIIVAFISKFLCELVYYGVLFNTNNFASGNPFLYVALSGMADAVAVLVGVVTSKTLSRKLTIGGGFVTSGIFLLVVVAIPRDMQTLQWILVLSGFLMTAVSSQTFYVYLPELFPTNLRGKGFAICNLAGNLGILFAPLVSDVLGEEIWWGPGIVLGCSGIIGGFLILLLPETKDRKMCETVEDVEKRAYGKAN